MTPLYFHKVEVSDGSGIIRGEEASFDVSLIEVIGENDKYVVVKDFTFTTIQRRLERNDSRIYPVIGDPSISIFANDRCWGNRIWYRLYSEKTIKPFVIRNQIEREIEKRFGYFTGAIDLSFITKKGAK